MDITFPPELQWVSYLAGGAWPQGSETRMWSINEHFASAAAELQDLIPDLNRVRSETLSVLFGDTAMAADDQFEMLFGGDYSVDKLAQGASALGDGAHSLGVEIEYSKLSIIVGLALAAVEISWCLANSVETFGASTAWIPTIEWATMTSIRRLMATVFERISTKLGQMLEQTTIKDLVHHGVREAFQELGQGLAQEGIVQGIQVGQGNSTWRPDLIRQNAVASFIGGAAGGGTALPVSHGLGPGASKLGRAAKGMTTMFTAGIAGNVAGTAAVGGEFDTLAVIGSSAGSSIGGVKGLGGHAGHPDTEARTGLPDRTGEPPLREPLPGGPLFDDDDATNAEPDTEPKTDEPSVNGQAPPKAGGARVAGESGNGQLNTAAARSDPAARSSTDTPNSRPAKAGVAVDEEAPSTRPADADDPTTHAPEERAAADAPAADVHTDDSHTADTHTANAHTPDAHTADLPAHNDAPANSVVDQPHPAPTQDGSLSVPQTGPESSVQPTADQASVGPTDPAPATQATVSAPEPSAASVAPVAPAANAAVPPTTAPQPPASHPAAATPTTQPATASPAPTPTRPVQENVSASPTKTASASETTGAPAARVADTAVQGAEPTTTTEATGPTADRRADPHDNCANHVADALSTRYGRDFRVQAASTATGVPARALFEGAGSRPDFASYADVADRLRQLGPGSSAILTSAWAGDGHRQGGHAYLAVNDGGEIHVIDSRTGERTGWPPHWGQHAVSRTAVGYLDSRGMAVHPMDGSRNELAAADAVGDVKGHPDGDPGERWRDVTPQDQLADDALSRRGVQNADGLRNPLGLMEAASERARDNATWWHGLTGDEQRALIDAYPHHIGNAEGIPAGARHAANTHALDQQRRELQAWRDRGERLTRFQRKELARLDRIQEALDRAGDLATEASVGGPLLLAFDSGAFNGGGRAVVSFGEDPYKADMVAWHVPGQGMTIDQLGYCMGDALNHLQSTLAEDSSVSASSIAWIGYDTPSGRHSWRAAGHTYAREGAKMLYSDIRAFNAARDTLADDGSHFSANNVFAHSYGATTTSYAGRDGRLANDIRTVTLAGSSGAGPLRHAGDFGIGADNVYVASSSRDPFTALGGRIPGATGRLFGFGLGVDPAMQSFGAQRITAEFSSAMDQRGNRGTHNAYYRFADRGADPPLRSESLANFGRIASGHAGRVDTEGHRTVGERPRRLFGGTRDGTVEPAADRPLRLDGDTEQSVDRESRRLWNPRWRAHPAEIEPSHAVDGAVSQLEPPMSSQERADLALADRGISAGDLMSPADHRVPVRSAVARAEANGHWWRGLTEAQRRALIETYPHQVGNAEGIPPMARHEANSLMLQQHLADRDVLVSRRQNGVAINKKEQQFVDLMDQIERAIRTGERNTQRAGVGGPYLLALDPFAFDGVGRAIVSVGHDPYTAESVSWYVPGMSTTIEKLNTMMQRGFHQLQSTLRENPELSAASITYLGYKPPGSWDRNVLSRQMAIDGGQIFASDILSFNAGRDIFAGDGSHFSGNHVFAHSYGSSTVSHAGQDGRLADEVRTITLIGSPGAGNLRHASEFGIGDNVFVASSSRDLTTALGGDRPGRFGRNHSPERLGQGVDPSMDTFGARRITAEFPAAIDRAGGGSRMTHSLYWAYLDPGANPHVRSESLTNFGRIAAGRAGDIDSEGHRRVGEHPRRLRGGTTEHTVEPAIGRPLRLADDPAADHSVRRRHLWNPPFRNVPLDSVATSPVGQPSPVAELTAAEVGEVQQVPAPVKVVADAALQDRGIRARDLMSPVDHRVPTNRAVARAEANGKWWKGLTDNQRRALIEAYPHEVGNAEGIPPMDRHEANSRMLQRYLAHRDVLVSRRSNGVALNNKQAQFVDLMEEIEDAMRKGVANAHRAGVGGPYLLALDPWAFGGAGRAIVSFGEDPYTAKSVSWYVPGMTTTIDKMHPMMMRAFNQLQSTLQQNPDLSAASITYIGYRAPGSWDPNVVFQRLARQGGNIFASDISSFNAGRDVFAGDGSHFRGNHVFAHSYGSSTVSHAGQGGRLAGEMQTVTLIGSPGAGPLRHASDFGIGADNVFVASSSRDRTTGLGGDRPNHRGRNLTPARVGQGIDPAMDSFGARRVTAEFPAAVDHLGPGSRMTHSLYWAYMDPGASPRVRSESLTNFGRIAAGQSTDVDTEGHRRLDQRPRWLGSGSRDVTVEPAIGRHLRLPDDPTAHHSVHGRNYWNPNFERTNGCGPAVIDELSARYPGHEFRLVAVPSPNGVQAFRLFAAVRSSSEFSTYAQIEERLRELGPGSSALLASQWRGWRSGGHAYLAVNDGGEIYLIDAHSGLRSGWPPHWGQDAVTRTAVGYLDATGDPVVPHDGGGRRFAAASRIGHVQGLPESGVVADAALGHRGIPAEGLVNPIGSSELAAERARANATWWAGLSAEQRQALIEVHAYRIGNAEGIPAVDRDTANRAFLQELRDRADKVQTKIDEFGHANGTERKLLARVNDVDLAVRMAEADAARAGLDPPLLLALDPSEFGGNGRAVLSFGADPYHADNVSWHTARQSVDRLGTVVRPALDQLQSTLQHTSSASAVVWVGDETSKPRLALHSDLAAFHAARDALSPATDGRPFTGNRVHTDASSSTAETSRPLWVPREAGSMVVAHRGASHEFPEQTLAAYREALRQGADGLETDIRLTKDGHLVCIHDKRIDRTSNGTGRVGDMTLAELQQYDFGSQHPSHELGDAEGDTGILTLDQLLQLVTEHDRPVTLFIEAKEHGGRLERELVALLDRHGLATPTTPDQSRVAVISFYPDAIWRVHRAAPDLPTVLLGSTAHHLAATVGATAIGPSIKTLRAQPELVDIAARQGLTTYCWTVNDESDVQFARDLGVGWIATDHPGRTGDMVHGEHVPAREKTAPTTDVPVEVTAADTAQVAESALAQRIPPVRPDELRNPLGPMEEARARARNNATWWNALTSEQRTALIETHPQHIGNAEGIPAADRHTANHRVLQQLRDRADQVQARIDDGARPSRADRKFLQQVNRLDLALRKAGADAARVGVDGPVLLAFDPAEFGGDGRAVLSFGDDPYTADSVSWHVPGVATTVHSLFGFYTESALNHLQSTRSENPTTSAASIAWIGYDTPSGMGIFRAAGHQLARTGGDLLYSDITAFNAARDTLAGDGSHFTGNHVFGYSYGSTTTGYAGQGGRLAGQISTVSLVGSPGVGPMRHAGDFGIGADHVFVASSSRDLVTALGGRTPGSSGRILGIGLGVDPAMDYFGAQRIAAEFTGGRNQLLTGGTHHAYYLDTGTGTHVRTESLANLGRIAAGRHDQVTTEAHRTVDGRRTLEPAANRSDHRIWNPPWRSDRDCAHVVADELSSMYGRDIRIAGTPSRSGTPARSLFEAAGTRAEFATYDDVAHRLIQLGDGSSAVLASRWAGGRNGGHAYLAINDGGEIQLYDPHTRQRSAWPPHWGENAVSRTAVGYLGAHGNPVSPLTVDTALQLGAADAVGHVRGLPADPDFVRRQEEYRAQDPATRHVDTRYAQSLADVIDDPSQASVNQLADDLSGMYGPHRIRFDEVDRFGNEVLLTGKILHGDTEIGTVQRGFARDSQGNLVAYHNGLVIKDEFTHQRGQGFSKALTAEMERFYVHSGVDRIELQSHDKGTRAWARRGFTWDPDPARLQQSLDRIRDAALHLSPQLSAEARTVLDELVQRLHPDHPRLPELIDIVDLAAPGVPNLGERLVDGVKVNFVRYLPSDVTTSTPQAHNGFGARLKRLFGIGGGSRSDQDCARTVADELSAMYEGRDIRVATARTPMGTPAWALFEAVGTRAEFATYDDVAGRLHRLGDGASAVLASRWAGGHRGGHAYLAVNEDGEIRLYDPHTRQRSGWPPHWGQGAVAHTAVGYLDADGNPVQPVNDVPLQLQLDAADLVGDVKGHAKDPDFQRAQAEYRAQDVSTREVNTRYAEPLADVVRNLDQQQVRQLADDLSGIYGPYRVEMWRAEISRAGEVIVAGYIFSGDEGIGFMQRTFVRGADGNLVARHDSVEIDQERFKFKGFSRSLSSQLEPYYARSGVDRIELSTEQDGGYVWARRGFTWNADTDKLEHSLQSVRDAAQRLMNWVSEDAQAVLLDTVQRLESDHPRLPEPIELASLATPDEPDLGRQLMYGTKWFGVKHLLGEPTVASTALTPSDFAASPARGLTDHFRGLNCAHLVANEVWEMYGREIRIEEPITSSGVPARALFEAIGSHARFATYDEVADELRRLGPGSSAVLASRWAGGRQGGHAYLAINVDDEIFLVESHSGRQQGWPPYWGEGAVARTAVGYLDPDGNPTHPLHDRVLQLSAADEIGDVAGPREGLEFQRAQEDYRAQDPTSRQVDTRYAEPLGDVVDDCWDRARVQQLAEDLSGMYGPYRVEFYPQNSADAVFFDGVIFSGTQEIGTMMRRFARDGDGNLVAHHILVSIDDEHFRGNGFSKALTSEFERYYQRSGFDRIQLATSQNGGYAWARRGFTWNPDPARLEPSLRNIRASAYHLRRTVSAEAARVLDDVMARLHPERSDLPDPIDLAALATPDEPDLGRRLMDGAQWNAVKYLRGDPAAETSSHNCAQMVTDELSARYGRDVRLGIAPSRSGVPARALFEAVGSSSRFATYDDVAQNLRELGERSAAVLASGWAHGGGRYGGHAYLAVNDGGLIHLVDPFTGERTGWPPAWGQHAVYRTAVGYLDANGDAVHPLGVDRPLHLYAAETVGDVKGHPDDGDGPLDGSRAQLEASTDTLGGGYPSPDDVELAGFWDRIGQLDLTASTPEAIAEAVYQPVPLDDVTNLYEGRVSGFKTGEVVRAQQHLAETMDNAFFVSADIANLRGLNQASADRTESNAHFSAMADIFRAGLTESGADVVPMRVGGDELGAVVVGDIDDEVIDSALATIRTRVKEYAQEHNLADIPHPKHPGQPEYNGVGLHLGYAEVLPDLDVRDIFNLADLGVDQSKTRSTDVAGGQGRATRADGVEPGGAATAYRAAGTRTGRETTGSEGEVAGRASTEGEPGHALSHRVRYPQPEDVRRAAFIDQAARIRDADPGAVLALHEPLRRDEVSDFYDGRGAAFKTGEVDRARRWTTETGGSGFFVSAQLVNLSGLNQHVQNRAEVANAHYRAVTEIFRTEIEATGATVVPMRTSGDRFDAVVVGRIEAATVDAAITAIHEEIGMYTRREGLSDIANPSNAERRGVHLRFGYADITTSRDAEGVVQTAEARMFGRKDFGDPRRAPETPIDDIPRPRQPAPAENPVFLREQRDYRAQDRTTRNVDTRFAEPLPDVLDNAGDGTNIDRLATDLSGGYGPYRVNFRGEGDGDVFLAGVIMRGDRAIGTVELDFFRDHTGDLIASIGWIAISDDTLQRKGFTQSLIGELEQYCQRSGVDRMSLATQDNGGVVWARLGFTWDRDPQRLQLSLDSVKSSALRLRDEVTDGARAVLDDIVARLDPQRSDLPEPRQLTEIATRDVPDLGRRLMDGTRWFAVKHLHGDVSPSSAQLANDALAQRIPPAGVTELVHPNGDAELAVERAQANATWWQGLSEDLRQAMVENHPVQIGNAEGIPPSYRHDANARALADWLRHRDQLQFRRDSGFRLGFDKQKELDFLNSVDDALRRGADAARTAGVDGPRLLKFDPSAFDGNGIAVVGFGVDPYLADSVSWHIPGRGMTIEQLGAGMGSALNHLSSVLHEDPTASAASVTWIGYDTVANDAARIGGETLYADIRAFNTGRDAWVTDGSHFGNNHVYGHCQGSTVVGHAGAGGRLDRTVRTVILFGSPGAGPINHAREFGQGVDVYVAASSTDSFTWEAGHTPGSRGTFLDGFGVDPAMDFFGAQRITAEFPLLRMAAAGDYDMHNFYYKFDDKSTGLRTESLANFGRIASGHVERVALEEQRAAKLPDQTQIYDPASVRPAVEDHRPPVVEPAENCAHAVAETLSTRYGHDVRIEARTSPTGVAARGLFEAVGSRAEFAPYAEVADRLVQLGSGSSAVLASRWAGTRHGGHAYLAVNDGGELYLVDARTGGRSGWPPHWGERAVAQTAAGFLDASGQPVRALGDNADELVAADAIGDVQGAPHEPVGPLGLPDYAPGTLSDVEATTVYSHGEQRMRELDEQLQREGMGAEERARILFEQKNSLRAWTRDLMSNRTAAEVLAANESTLTFDELVARNEAKGLSGDAVFDAIIDTATHGRFAPGSLSDVETTLVYSDFELRLRELNEQLVRDGMPVDERARLLSDLRSSLRGWTRELMSNRAAADWLAANESNPSFEDLVARYQTKGLTGDAVYEAIIDAATHSHYATGTLSNAETRTVYTTFELRMREVSEQLVRDDVGLEEQARTLYELRASIRTWTRALMADRETADYLTANEPNPTFEDLVARQRAKGRVGDEIYRAIIASATRSRASVNESLGIDPENPPELPPMRGPTNND